MADFYDSWKDHTESLNPQATTQNRMADILGTDKRTGSSFGASQNSDYGDDILEGKSSKACCCKITGATVLGDYVFTCCETTPGECAFRIGSEPSLTCLYRVDRSENGSLHKACIREEARDWAIRQMYVQAVEKQKNPTGTEEFSLDTSSATYGIPK